MQRLGLKSETLEYGLLGDHVVGNGLLGNHVVGNGILGDHLHSPHDREDPDPKQAPARDSRSYLSHYVIKFSFVKRFVVSVFYEKSIAELQFYLGLIHVAFTEAFEVAAGLAAGLAGLFMEAGLGSTFFMGARLGLAFFMEALKI